MEPLIKPGRVRPGDTVAVVSPSFGAVGRWPHRVERATAYLESLGLRVRLMPNAARSDGWASASPEDRVADLHAAFSDDEVTIVLAGIGGNHSNQLLPLLDFGSLGPTVTPQTTGSACGRSLPAEPSRPGFPCWPMWRPVTPIRW